MPGNPVDDQRREHVAAGDQLRSRAAATTARARRKPAHHFTIPGVGRQPHTEQSGAASGAIGEFVDTVVKPDEAA